VGRIEKPTDAATMSSKQVVRFQMEEGVGVATLADPSGVNVLSEALLEGLIGAIDRARDDPGVRALLIRAEGRVFCAGADLSQIGKRLDQPGPGSAAQYIGHLMEHYGDPLVNALQELPKAVICAVGGAAVGGGVGLALAADMVIAARSAYFSLPFVPALGLIPDLGATYHLTMALGRARGLALSLTGEKFSAERAENWGLIWRCVEDESLLSEATALARQCAELPFATVKATKDLFRRAETGDLASQLRVETELQRKLAGEDAFREGVNAFLERRKPRFFGPPS
jgi:2-(1,2-epoxy-1,2-dihydrophenyl)acetyl-CoA isomerase